MDTTSMTPLSDEIISLRDYFGKEIASVMQAIEHIDELLSERISALDAKADERARIYEQRLIEAKAQLELRLGTLNEIAQALRDQNATFARIERVDRDRAEIEGRMRRLDEQAAQWIPRGEFEGRKGEVETRLRKLDEQAAGWIPRGEFEGRFKGLDPRFESLGQQITVLETARNVQTGRTLGQQATIALIVFVLGVIGFVLANFITRPRP